MYIPTLPPTSKPSLINKEFKSSQYINGAPEANLQQQGFANFASTLTVSLLPKY